jgi:hypothetical protein
VRWMVGDPVGYDGERIWLRQSVSSTKDGQTRTMEIAISLRQGMTAGQVEALLKEADSGMQRLSHYLNTSFAGADAGSTVSPDSSMSLEPPAPLELPRSHEVEPIPPAVPGEQPIERKAAGQDPDHIAPSAHKSPAAALPVPTASPAQAKSPVSAAELSIKDFLDAARAELDLSPKQAMEKLGVKSLQGIDLHAALDTLRRQTAGARREEPVVSGDPPPAASSSPASAVPPRYFEEEDDSEFDVTFHLDDESDELDLEDVPDFDAVTPPPSLQAVPTAKRSAPAKPAAHGTGEGPPEQSVASGQKSTTLELIGQLRAAAKGSNPTSQQRIAYRNIIQEELGEQPAKALVAGLWRVPAERLGAEQMDALLSWGKRDTFGEEAVEVLAALRAERERKGAPSASGDTSTGSASSTPVPRRRS